MLKNIIAWLQGNKTEEDLRWERLHQKWLDTLIMDYPYPCLFHLERNCINEYIQKEEREALKNGSNTTN